MTDFDALLKVASGRLELGPGVYHTKGLWNHPIGGGDYSSFQTPIQIIGAGIDRTIIRLESPVTEANGKDRVDLHMMRFGKPWKNNGGPYLVQDLTIDGNEAAFPGRYVTGGLEFHSNNVMVKRVKAFGFRGSHELHHESFPILIRNDDTGDYKGPDGNNRVIECVVESTGDRLQPYLSPIYIGTRHYGRPLLKSEIVSCRVLCTSTEPGDAIRIGCSVQCATDIERLSVHGCQHAIYSDTGEVIDVNVRNSRFTGITYSGPWFILDGPINHVLFERCEFEYAPKPGQEWIGVVVWDKNNKGTTASDVIVRECVFRWRPPELVPQNILQFTPQSVKGQNVEQPTYTGNTAPRPFTPPTA